MSLGERCPGRHREKGAVLVLVAVSMAVLLGVVALAVDLGYLMVTRNGLQNVADGSALAGARSLGSIYQGLTYSEQKEFQCNPGCQAQVIEAAQDVARKNRVGGVFIEELEEVFIGTWDASALTFDITNDQPDAVWVIARREQGANGAVSTFFARVLAIDQVPVNAEAIAAMTGMGNVGEGELSIPIGISEYFWGAGVRCNDYIKFYPSNDPESCAGWTSWEYGSNDITMRRILDGEEGYENPELSVDDLINFTGGTLSTQVFNSLLELYKFEGCATSDVSQEAGQTLPRVYLDKEGLTQVLDPDRDCVTWREAQFHDEAVRLMEPDNKGDLVPAHWPDGTTPRFLHQWRTAVPVYQSSDCANPNQSLKVAGFTQVIITNVLSAPDKMVDGVVLCDQVNKEPTRGGGGNYGLKGPIPGLVW